MNAFDVLVLGGGPGGYVAAIRAAQHGLKVALVEKESRLGGTCLLRGCIPTKSLLHAADLWSQTQHLGDFGIQIEGRAQFDFAKIQAQRHLVVDQSARGVDYLLQKRCISVFHGTGTLLDAHRLQVDLAAGGNQILDFRNLILATGSQPRRLTDLGWGMESVLTSDEALELASPPQSLIVIGGGAIGVEFASIYGQFGTAITIVESAPRLLPGEDSDVSAAFMKSYRAQGMNILTHAHVLGVRQQGADIEVDIKDEHGQERCLAAEKLLLAIGRKPMSSSLGLENLGIAVDEGGYICIDEYMRTSLPHVYAIGDVVKTPWLAHVASAEGLLAVDHLAGQDPEVICYDRIPSCIYANPEVASVGLSEQKAIDRGYTVQTGKFPFSALGKARISGKTEGFIKIVAEKRYGEILGVHIIGGHATDLIAEACAALKLECTVEELARIIHPHPTLTEGMPEAAHMALGKGLHLT
jgi:dihydrolipoamide dehydrogenase